MPHEFDRYKYESYDTPQTCECGELSERQVCAPMMVRVENIAYTSPIDGRPITSKQARIEDLPAAAASSTTRACGRTTTVA
jgi:hypothetical protein